MRVLQLQIKAVAGGARRGLSVWVETDDARLAQERAVAALAAAGWSVEQATSNEATSADDYFRTCPSQQAFVRAQEEGVACRFDDE